jgi:membrane protein implicated in regulation of membrane protease activity
MALGILPKILLVAVGWNTIVAAFTGNPVTAVTFGLIGAALYAGIAYFIVRQARKSWQNVPETTVESVDTGQARSE